jgi:hypothetical protein
VGVPEIAQVEVEKVRPVGSEGLTTQELMNPPVLITLKVEIARPLVNENGLPVYEITGTLSMTVI